MGGTWLGVGTGLVPPGEGTWMALGHAWGWGQCHPGVGTWMVSKEMGGQCQCPQEKRGWWHPGECGVGVTQEKLCEWHLAGHGVGVIQKGHGWDLAGHGVDVTQEGCGWHLFGCGVGVTWGKGCRWHLARHGNVMSVTHRDAGLGGAGCPHPDVQRQAVGPLSGGAAQAGGLQHVATASIAQEAPGVQVHLIAWCLEVEGHCGDRRMGYQRG